MVLRVRVKRAVVVPLAMTKETPERIEGRMMCWSDADPFPSRIYSLTVGLGWVAVPVAVAVVVVVVVEGIAMKASEPIIRPLSEMPSPTL